jgi:hypothetical protein
MLRLYATSAAVSGEPSDHFTFGWIVIVRVFPPFETLRSLASTL